MPEIIEVEVPEFNPPPKAYAVTIKPVYALENGEGGYHGGNDDYKGGWDVSASKCIGERIYPAKTSNNNGDVSGSRSFGERIYPAKTSNSNGDLSKGVVGDYFKLLESRIQKTGCCHYRGFQGCPLEDLCSFLRLPVPNPRYMPSKLTGTRKALCIGINYTGQSNELRGCANDARNMRKFLIQKYGFRSSQVMILTDDNHDRRLHPTRQNMIGGMKWLVEGARPHDSLFIHYSGHGGQKKDTTGQKEGGLDENKSQGLFALCPFNSVPRVIFPSDFKQKGDIVDHELNQILVQPLPPGCRLTGIFDCCHSGTVLDLPYLRSAHGRIKKTHISNRARTRQPPPADVICFSACKDDETSADTFEGGIYVGAMSYAMIKALNENVNQTYEQVLESARNILRPKYKQKPQLSASNPVVSILPPSLEDIL
ncbi:Caspase domain containing protein [Amanita muscaria]